MIPKYRMWNRITSKLHRVDGLYFDNKEVQYIDEVGILRFIKFENTILMQSTGLKNKNGKEIFEGDILKVANNDSSWFEVVKYDHDKAMFISKEVNLKYEVPETPLFDLFSPYLFKVEVIGNIWENPDLLGTKLGSEE